LGLFESIVSSELASEPADRIRLGSPSSLSALRSRTMCASTARGSTNTLFGQTTWMISLRENTRRGCCNRWQSNRNSVGPTCTRRPRRYTARVFKFISISAKDRFCLCGLDQFTTKFRAPITTEASSPCPEHAAALHAYCCPFDTNKSRNAKQLSDLVGFGWRTIQR
jgi:hypothetical protein